ncbi:MAG: sulfurtransferase [Flavobacterium sp. BFFFF1]|uniref:sulfurtransferase n=1 Tax=Flavobacterium sp. BFFFF1 TaxID=2015557 RepID=UPI000BC83F21|nr:sulfurtransferase [Flavobacterium sp. BFFFF1]OYU81727.1 MAG: sulfurtransferase [Flavobacterium sp. BFFFF1]
MEISPIIEVDALLAILSNPNVLIFDVSNHKNAKANFEKAHLERALFVETNSQLAEIRDDLSGGRHPLPKIARFAETVTSLGINENSHVVLYDDNGGSNAAARFWWMLRSAGHQNVQVLNGGIGEAKRRNFPLATGSEPVRTVSQPYQLKKWNLPTVEINQVAIASQDPNYLVVDVRDQQRYDGIAEPIDLIAGHIPGAINIPFTENLDADGLFLNPTALRDKYKAKFGEIRNENIIVHCGSGVTACHTILSLEYAGMGIPKLYIGSWSEWSRSNRKIEKKNG